MCRVRGWKASGGQSGLFASSLPVMVAVGSVSKSSALGDNVGHSSPELPWTQSKRRRNECLKAQTAFGFLPLPVLLSESKVPLPEQ